MPIEIPFSDDGPIEDSGSGSPGGAGNTGSSGGTSGSGIPVGTAEDPGVILPPVVQEIVAALAQPETPLQIDIADTFGFDADELDDHLIAQQLADSDIDQALIQAVKLACQNEPELVNTVSFARTAKETLQLLFAHDCDALTEEEAKMLLRQGPSQPMPPQVRIGGGYMLSPESHIGSHAVDEAVRIIEVESRKGGNIGVNILYTLALTGPAGEQLAAEILAQSAANLGFHAPEGYQPVWDPEHKKFQESPLARAFVSSDPTTQAIFMGNFLFLALNEAEQPVMRSSTTGLLFTYVEEIEHAWQIQQGETPESLDPSDRLTNLTDIQQQAANALYPNGISFSPSPEIAIGINNYVGTMVDNDREY